MTTMRRFALGLGLLVSLSLGLRGQDDDPAGRDRRPRAPGTITLPTEWTIKEEVKKLDSSLHNFNALIASLDKANGDLKSELEAYLVRPEDEVLASSVEKKMAQWVATVVRDFDRIITDQDVLVSNFKSLERKLGKFDNYLEAKGDELEARLTDHEKNKRAAEKKLIQLSIAIKEAESEDEIRDLKRNFSSLWMDFNMQERYLKGTQNHLTNYRNLQRSLGSMSGIFGNLQVKVVDLISNLENEKRYLLDSIRLQSDSLRVRQIMRDGIVSGKHAIKNVSEKLAKLYAQVDAFTTVNQRIGENLGRFVSSQEVLLSVSQGIDQIGQTTRIPDIDAAVEQFYQKRFEVDALPLEAEADEKPKSDTEVAPSRRADG
ncbi:MAG: hypothetical protein RL885_29015 [Planctomycetota bacterium]